MNFAKVFTKKVV